MRKDVGVSMRYAGSLAGDHDFTLDLRIPGDTLLLWLKQKADVKAAEAASPVHAGTAADPWPLASYADFVKAWTTLRRDEAVWKTRDCYFRVGGRLIRKFPADEKHGGVAGGHAEGYYMADVGLSGGGGGQAVWRKADGASYADFAKTFQAKMRASGKHADTPQGNRDWSTAKMQRLRNVMNGVADYSGKGADSTSAALPLLATVMFVSEPARNPRSFPIGLMMLDMISAPYNVAGTKHYILDRVLAHPDRIAGGKVPSKAQLGPTGRDWAAKGGATVGLAPINLNPHTKNEKKEVLQKLAMVEGKWSASPSGSARTQDAIDVVNDYIQMKELSILSRWVSRALAPAGPSTSLRIEALRHDDRTPRADLLTTTDIVPMLPATLDLNLRPLFQTLYRDLKSEIQSTIHQKIQERISTFNAM